MSSANREEKIVTATVTLKPKLASDGQESSCLHLSSTPECQMKIKTTVVRLTPAIPAMKRLKQKIWGRSQPVLWVESNPAERRNSGRVGKHDGYRMLKVNGPLAFFTPTSHSASKCTIELWAKTNPSSG